MKLRRTIDRPLNILFKNGEIIKLLGYVERWDPYPPCADIPVMIRVTFGSRTKIYMKAEPMDIQ